MNEQVIEEPAAPAEEPEQPDDGDTLPDQEDDTVPESGQ